MRMSARIFNTDFLPALLDVPLTLHGTATLEGALNADSTRSTLSLYAPGITYAENRIDDIRFYMRGEDGRLALLAQAETQIKGSNMELVLDASATEDQLLASLDWDDSGLHRYRGALSAVTEFGGQGSEKEIRTTLIPTTISINDTVWNVASGKFSWNGNAMSIDRFSLNHEASALTIDGQLAKDTGDSIIADLKNIDVSYILNLVNFHAVEFGGHATGRATLSSSLKNPMVDARLRVPDFHFNGAYLGDADIRGGWNNREKQIEFDAKMTEEGIGWTTVKGYVSPPRKCLDLRIGSENTNLAFLNRYVTGIFGDLEGRATGFTRLHGPFKELDFEGKEQARVSAKILATGVTYYLSGGSVDLSAGRFSFNNMDVEDGLGGRGRISGFLGHKHLKDITYDFHLDADNMLVYDKPKSVDMPFFATVYGTGKVNLKGEPGYFTADIDMSPEENTTFTYTIDTPEALGDVGFLSFGNRAVDADSASHESETDEPVAASGTDIRLNFLLDMNENAAMKIIMDEKAGDNISVTGNGIMRASFHNKGDFQMYGTYTVKEGKYRLSIQDFIRKDLEMAEGSKLVFAGNPQRGTLDLKAVYVVNSASLSDLNIGSSLSESSTRVNCILNIRGEVQNPEVSFDLELPSVSADEMQMVRNLISTEEDMNMQILYLLGVGRFYTYDFSTTETAA
ncbi:MAG: translocation/assembly module TamB domain-containing protein, partial [Bacteroidaceae bacterium]|nr:translocation/assembly module TamB domain-containing protein [Bacteroidaceae bacterium]